MASLRVGAGSPLFNENPGERNDFKDAARGDPCEGGDKGGADSSGSNPTSGNPVVLATGNKVEVETDFTSEGEMPLTLQRMYSHYWTSPGLFGRRWVSSFDHSLVWMPGNDVIYAQRPDGRRIKFIRYGTGNVWSEDKEVPLAEITQVGSDWVLSGEDNATEVYDGGGRPKTITNAQGVRWTFTYTSSRLTQVTHTSGRNVKFGWTGDQLTQVTAPDNSVFTYTYDANAFGAGQHRLKSSKSPYTPGGNGAVEITYYYENAAFPGGLTGKAYNGVRYSTFAYDTQGRTIKSEHVPAGVDRYTYVYTGTPTPPAGPVPSPPQPGAECDVETHVCVPPPLFGGVSLDSPEMIENAARNAEADVRLSMIPAVVTSVVETNPYGLQTTYQFTSGRLTSVAGAATTHCAARSKTRTYSAIGFEKLVTDFNGNVTSYDYRDTGQLRTKIEAYNTPLARTTTYTWDTGLHRNRLLTETVEGDHRVGYVYDADNRLDLAPAFRTLV